MKKKLLLSFVLLLTTLAMQAVPAKPVTKKVRLADGSVVELTLRGDEHFSYMTDAAGVPYLRKADGMAERTTMSQVTERWTAQRAQRLEARASSGNRASRRVGTAGVTTGKHHGLVILMQFTDVPFVTASPQATFDRFFNEPGYSDNGMAGSVNDYFYAQSYGKLDIDFDVVGPFTTANAMAYYGQHSDNDSDRRAAEMVAEAVDAAADTGVDFSKYDWDGDGVVDQVFVIYAGYAEAQGADENTIWPHEWSIEAGTGSPKEYDGIIVNTYGCSSELRGNGVTNTGIMDGIGTACHEFSHCMGLPDMYDTSGDNYAMATWDIMCMGSYNGDSNIPSAYTSYERWFSGWMEPTEIKTMTRITDMQPITEKPEAYILYNEKNKDEYYLLENRQQMGFDAAQYGHGLLILHVDYKEGSWTYNTVNVDPNHQRMTIIPADNEYGLYYPSSIAGDTWPGTSGNTMLTSFTTPAATLYNENSDGTKFMRKSIDNITEDTERHTVSFVACRPELGAPSPDSGTEQEGASAFKVTWAKVSGAVGYELELTEIGTASSDPKEALQNEYDFSGCVSKSNGLSDIGSKLSNYGLTGWTGSKLFTSPKKLKIGTSTTKGNVRTPTWKVPASQDITVVMGADVVKAGETVEGTLQIAYGNEGESATRETVDFKVTGDGKQVFHFTVRKDLFYLTIAPSSQMYLNYLAIYDGEWSAEQLGIDNAAAAPRRASVPQTFTTTANSYTFTGLNAGNRYLYRVRALGEDNTYSPWSEQQTFTFSSTGIIRLKKADSPSTARYYDLRGQEVSGSSKGLIIRKQGKEVKKVMVR